jgi:hypothetical protein
MARESVEFSEKDLSTSHIIEKGKTFTVKVVGGVATSERSVEPVVTNWLIGFDLVSAAVTILCATLL